MGIAFATVALIAAVVMFAIGICLWFMYNTASAHDWKSTVIGVIIMLGAIALAVYAGPTVWMHYITGPNTEQKSEAKVQVEVDALAPLARYYDAQKLCEVRMVPIVDKVQGEMEFTRPANLVSDTHRQKILADVHKLMETTDPLKKDWNATIERVRYYVEGGKIVSVYVRFMLTAPDPADPTKRIDKGFGSCTLLVAKPDYDDTAKNLRDARHRVMQKLTEAGIELPSNLADTVSTPASAATPADKKEDTISFLPSSNGLTCEPGK